MLAGQILDDRFLLQGVIGQGSFCTVYQATDQHRLKSVAVKVLKDSQMHSSFLAEVNAMKLLRRSGGIPRCYSYGTAGKHHYLAMELMTTDVMRLLQANGPLPACLLIQTAIETIKSLEKVHSAGLLHLDLKPDNLALRQKHGEISCFLMDFGLSERYINNGQHWKYSESYPSMATQSSRPQMYL
jgi:serine/threonine protein kinase